MGNRFYTSQISLSAISFSALSLTIALVNLPAIAGELYGFTLNRSNNTLSVNIQADYPESSDIRYTSNGATISLPAMQASQQLINSGLPIVIDDANTTIGRAVPQQDGSVAIVLPNVSDDTNIKINFVGRQAATTPISANLSGSSLPASGQAHFDAALNAAKTPLAVKPQIIKPVKSTPAPVSNPSQSVTLSPASVSKRSRPLPKVVPLTPEQPTPVATAPQASPPSTNRKPDESYGDNTDVESYSANTDWFNNQNLPEITGNAYGVLGVDSTLVPIPPEPTNNWLNSSKQFLDNISGNWFSRPYGVAFWGMVMAVLLLAGGGFVLVAIGLLLARVAFKPSAFVPPSKSRITDEHNTEPSSRHEKPSSPLGTGMQATIARYSESAGSPRKQSPFIGLRQQPVPPNNGQSSSLKQPATRPQRSSLWERLNTKPASAISTPQTQSPPVNNGHSLRHRLKKQHAISPVGNIPQADRNRSPQSTQQHKTVKDAVNRVLEWI